MRKAGQRPGRFGPDPTLYESLHHQNGKGTLRHEAALVSECVMMTPVWLAVGRRWAGALASWRSWARRAAPAAGAACARDGRTCPCAARCRRRPGRASCQRPPYRQRDVARGRRVARPSRTRKRRETGPRHRGTPPPAWSGRGGYGRRVRVLHRAARPACRPVRPRIRSRHPAGDVVTIAHAPSAGGTFECRTGAERGG